MAKVIITIEDADDAQNITVSSDFLPPLEANTTMTPAQFVALQLLDGMSRKSVSPPLRKPTL